MQNTTNHRIPGSALGVLVILVAAAVAAGPTILGPGRLPGGVSLAAAAVGDRPNIVLVLTDDMRKDDLRWMPKTRRLIGGRGTTFTRAVAPNPLCCPSRAELVTATYTHNNGVHSNGGQWGGFHALRQPDDNLGVWLQQAGYRTAYVGKYLNGWSLDDGIPKGWTHFDGTTKWVYEYTRYRFANDGRNNVGYRTIGRDAQGRSYITRAMTTIMNRWVDGFTAEKRPFFLFDSVLAPHMTAWEASGKAAPATPEPRYADLYAGAVNPATRSRAYRDPRVGDVPREARLPRNLPSSYHRRMFLGRIRALRSVDDHVARIAARLKARGVLRNTVFVFTSDNGFMNGEHRYSNKLLPYRESLSVPLLIAGPGFRHRRTARPVTLVDLASTIVDLAGATPGRRTDGRSFLGRLGRQKPRPIPIEGDVAKAIHQHPWGWRGVLWGRYTYARYWAGGEELYDTRRDPWQAENLVRRPRYRAVLTRLRTVFRRLRDCRGQQQCNPAARTPPAPR
ncbi:sulfatase [Nocardioides sp. KR10-350]|uniref:sulfatase family protein n=1 Tax=Nocardioides cheoyonin TaxID=3156615 RepID=UPI0032B52B1E